MTTNVSQPRNATVRELTASPITVRSPVSKSKIRMRGGARNPVDHRRREEQLDRVEARIVQRDPESHRHRQDYIEFLRSARPADPRQAAASAIAYAHEPARTGTANIPVPIRPSVNSQYAPAPASGRS